MCADGQEQVAGLIVSFGFKTKLIASDSSTTMSESGFCITSAPETA